ncbi:MAG: DUF1028 domain-containing protein [Nocardioidaceae bacterium]
MTFSLVGRCARTGMFGAVVTSSSPAVAARCAWARAGVGAACTQNVTDPTLGDALLDRLEAGRTAAQAIAEVVATASYADHRQLTVVDATGGCDTYSGARTLGRHRTATAPDCAAAGNLLADDAVPQAMVEAFGAKPDDHLGDRLLAALVAGLEAGGEEGPVHSCGLTVVDEVAWPVTDLRVDWHDDPIAELLRIWETWKPQADDYVTRALDPTTAPSYGVPGDD